MWLYGNTAKPTAPRGFFLAFGSQPTTFLSRIKRLSRHKTPFFLSSIFIFLTGFNWATTLRAKKGHPSRVPFFGAEKRIAEPVNYHEFTRGANKYKEGKRAKAAFATTLCAKRSMSSSAPRNNKLRWRQ